MDRMTEDELFEHYQNDLTEDFKVDPSRFLSNRFYKDLRKIYELHDFIR